MRSRLRGSHPQRREASRHAGSGADEVSASHQSQALGLDVPVHLQQIADEVIE
jgi:hypothetical protein